jgi:hypothetical protein
MRVCLIFMCWLGFTAIIPSLAFAVKGVTCTNDSAYYCVRFVSQCSSLGGFSCTVERCFVPIGTISGDLHWRPDKKSVAPADSKK